MKCPCCGKATLSSGPRAVVEPWVGRIQCLGAECVVQNIWVSPDGNEFKSLPGPARTPLGDKA